MISRLPILAFASFLAVLLALAPAFAQDNNLKKEELDQLLAPIALYPDDLLSNVLMAATYPLDVVQAARWKAEPQNAKLKGEALDKALEAKDWDPSIKSLVRFPDVLKTMSEKLDWTQKLGETFLAQQDEVMDEIQFLRQKADEAGNLNSNKQQKVAKESGSGSSPVYVIEPAEPDIVYVPVYQPSVVYGSWWYPDNPPYYWGYPGAAFVHGFFWGAGIAVAHNWWGWGHCDWRRRNIDIDVNRYNNINVNRPKITSNKWEFNAAHRGPVPYKNKAAREKYGAAGRTREAGKDFRGFDRGDLDASKIDARLKDMDHSQVKDRVGDKAGDKVRDMGGGDRVGDKARDRASIGDQKVNKNVRQQAAKRPSPAAFDVKRGSDVRRQADRGRASVGRARSAGHSLGGPRGGGGGGHRGGGGGGRRR